MNRLDDALKAALQKEDPGPEFTREVLARAAAAPPRRTWWRTLLSGFRPPVMRWATAAVLACALLVTGLEYRREQRVRAQGEAAKEQLVLAMKVAGAKLRAAQEKVLQRGY
jgi:hypothetical protein